MEQQPKAPDDFKLRRGGKGKLRVWQWLTDPRITIRERLNSSNGVGYRVTLPKKLTGGPVIFLQSRDFEAAKEIVRSRGKEFRESRSTALALPDDKKLQAASAVRTLHEHGLALGLDEIARRYCAADATLKAHSLGIPEAATLLAAALTLSNRTGKPLLDVVAAAVERLCPAGGSKTLAELTTEMIEIKRGWFTRGDLRKASFHDFEIRAGKIGKDIGSFPLPDLTKQIVYDWLNGLKLAPRTRHNYRMVLIEEQGHAVAQSNLGFMYANGDGVPKDETEAVKWYRKAAERGVALAQSQLGWMYENGSGVPKDPVEAVKWCRKAAEQGYAAAQHNLGVMYYNGTGVIKNPAQAHAWWSIAGSRGFKEAKKNLVSLEKEMTAEQKAEAMKLAQELFARLPKK